MGEASDINNSSISQQIKREYRIVQLLGRGGMGEVYLAEQLRVGKRPVALKVLNSMCCADPEIVRRFENEAASAGRINHRNVVMVYESRVTDDGQIYVAMEYVNGSDLGHLIHENGRLPLEEVVDITKQAAAGLSAAHKLGIVHRDVKPANIMLTQGENGERVVKVLDFGIARLSEPDSGASQTRTGVVMGTPYYMSPEQALGQTGESIDYRSDIYSLAVVVYQMLTGKPVFESESWMQVIHKHISEAPVPPSQVRTELAKLGPIDQVVLKGLEKDREKRQQSAVEFARELESAYAQMEAAADSRHTALYHSGAGLAGTPIITTASASAEPTKSGSAVAETGAEAQPTARMATGHQAETVTLLLESLPPGASVSYGDGQKAKAGADGRAAVSLPPGTHEIVVTDPGGWARKQSVTIGSEDLGSLKTLTIAPPSATLPGKSSAPPPPTRALNNSRKSGAGKKIAMAVSAIILLGLAAAAYFVLNGGKQNQEIVTTDSSVASAAASPQASETQVSASQAPSPSRENPSKAENGAESKPKVKEPGANSHAATESPTPVHKPPAEPTPVPTPTPAPSPAAKPSAVAGGNGMTCLGFSVTWKNGDPCRACTVEVSDPAVGQMETGKTGPLGRQLICGLRVGHLVNVKVLGPKGRLLANREMTLVNGRNVFAIQPELDQIKDY